MVSATEFGSHFVDDNEALKQPILMELPLQPEVRFSRFSVQEAFRYEKR